MPDIRVLVVDEDYDNAESLSMVLQLGGFAARPVVSGREAVDVASHWKPQAACIEVVVRDGDGYELRAELERLCNPVVVAITAWQGEELRSKSMRSGFAAHVVKPYEPEFLNHLLHHLLLRRESLVASAAGSRRLGDLRLET